MTYRRTLELRIATVIAMNLWVFDLDSDDGSTCHHNSSPLNLPYLLFEQFTPHFADHRTCDAQSYLEDATERSSWDEYDRSYMTSWLECTRQDPQDSLTNHRCDHTYQDFANLIASGNVHACNAGVPPQLLQPLTTPPTSTHDHVPSIKARARACIDGSRGCYITTTTGEHVEPQEDRIRHRPRQLTCKEPNQHDSHVSHRPRSPPTETQCRLRGTRPAPPGTAACQVDEFPPDVTPAIPGRRWLSLIHI